MLARCSLITVCCCFVITFAPAQGTPTVPSPDRRCQLRFHGFNPSLPTSFTIEDGKGTILFDSKACAELAGVLNFDPEHVLWSPDSQTIAIAGGYSKNLQTYLFSSHHGVFASTPVPWLTDRYDNPWVLPLRWIKGRRLIVTISGPHAGKAEGFSYRGRATLHVPRNEKTCEVHYQHITEQHERLSD